MNKEKLKSMATSLFQKSKDKLWSFGAKKPAASDTSATVVEELKAPPIEEEKKAILVEEDKRIKAKVKSLTNLERLYMIDIVEKGKKEIELVLHFVNK